MLIEFATRLFGVTIMGGLALGTVTGCARRPQTSDAQELRCSPMHNPPVQRLPPLNPAVWRRGAKLADSTAFTGLVIRLASTSSSPPIAITRVILTSLAPQTGGVSSGNAAVPPGATVGVATDSSGVARITIRAGRYAVRSIGIGYLERRDTITTRGGVTDTLLLDMRAALYCLY